MIVGTARAPNNSRIGPTIPAVTVVNEVEVTYDVDVKVCVETVVVVVVPVVEVEY